MPAALLSLFVAAVVGLGLWVFPGRAARGALPPGSLFVAAVLGLSLSHVPCYVGMSVATSVRATFVLGSVALAAVGWRAWSVGTRPRWGLSADVLLAIAAYPAFKILTEPLLAWDARSIWFFQGKIAYLSPAGLLTDAWSKPELGFAHTDYPKLLPLLAAQGGVLTGFWNDHWPKMMLLVLLVVFQLGVHALPLRAPVAWLVSLVVVASVWQLLWNGYADGYVAAFTCLAGTSLGLLVVRPEPRLAWIAAAALGLLAQMKNEGLVLAVLLATAFAVTAWRRGQLRAVRLDWRMAIVLAPIALWIGVKAHYGLHNDVLAGARTDWLLARLVDRGFWALFARYYFLPSPLQWALPAFVASVLVPRLWGQRWGNPAGWMLLGVYAAYTGFMVMAFGLTYWSVQEHLSSSMSRLAFALVALLLAAVVVGWRRPDAE